MHVDFPAFDLPTKANSGKFSAGKKSSEGAVVKNLAVCIQPMAIFSAAAFSALAICAGVGSVAGALSAFAGEFGEDVVIASIRTAMSAVLSYHLVGNYQNCRKPVCSL
jgi:hypothetical protein